MKTVRFVNAAGRAPGALLDAPPGDRTGGWAPDTWLGAPTAGGLALPSARPTASWLYAPRGVHLSSYRRRTVLVAADTGNHRLLIWHDLPTSDQQPCDVVLGQPDATSEGPAAGGRSTRLGLFLPTGVLVHDGMLIVADAWHHRVLIYGQLPEHPGVEPDLVLGQDGPDRVEANRGGDCSARSMYWPFGVAIRNGRFYVADTGNHRVIGWSGGVPSSAGIEPDLVLGQPGPDRRDENRGGPPSADSLHWPHDISGTGDVLLVADTGNHRLVGWSPHPVGDRSADIVVGQRDFDCAADNPYAAQPADALRSPYAVDVDEGRLAVADTANNRILLWDLLPETGPTAVAAGADVVLGQPGFGPAGENRWQSVARDTLCWPYGLSLLGDRLAIADSGNNRIMLWRRK